MCWVITTDYKFKDVIKIDEDLFDVLFTEDEKDNHLLVKREHLKDLKGRVVIKGYNPVNERYGLKMSEVWGILRLDIMNKIKELDNGL